MVPLHCIHVHFHRTPSLLQKFTFITTMNTSQLHDVLERARVECGIVGMSVAVLYKGELIFAEGFGKRNFQDPFTVEVSILIDS